MLQSLQLLVHRWNVGRAQARHAPLQGQRRQPYKLGIMAIMKNEAMNLVEWMEHYQWQGVERFYLIDNGSTDNSLDLLKPWIDAGIVKVIVLTKKWAQNKHYRTAFTKFKVRDEVQWLAIADLDEFWFCTRPSFNIAKALDEFDNFHVIYANWAIFGSSGHVTHPSSLRRCLTKRQPHLGPDVSAKWICQTSQIKNPKMLSMHKVRDSSTLHTISANDTFQLNHYVTQSVDFFQKVKMTRGDASKRRMDAIRDMNYFNCYDQAATLEDRLLANLLENQ